MSLKLGRKPAVRSHRTETSKDMLRRALAPLGAPPPVSDDYVSPVVRQAPAGWGMMGNDQWGDCVEADDAHYLMLRTANTGSIVIPTTDQVLALYSAETGFNPSNPASDQGTDEASDCEFLVSTGFLGHKADATSAIDSANLSNVRWCIQLFGGCKFGVNLPQSAMDQFNANQPWTVLPNDGGILGGHDILGVQYDGVYFYVVTWGKIQQVVPAWILKYADEAHALLFADWIEANGNAPSGFDLAALLADLASLSQPTPTPTGNGRRHRHHRRVKRRESMVK